MIWSGRDLLLTEMFDKWQVSNEWIVSNCSTLWTFTPIASALVTETAAIQLTYSAHCRHWFGFKTYRTSLKLLKSIGWLFSLYLEVPTPCSTCSQEWRPNSMQGCHILLLPVSALLMMIHRTYKYCGIRAKKWVLICKTQNRTSIQSQCTTAFKLHSWPPLE